MIKTIKGYDFDVQPFTAYESIMLASELAGIFAKLIKVYDKNNPIMSIIGGLEQFDGELVIKVVKKILSKTYYKKQLIDLDDASWAKKNLYTIFELCYQIVIDEYSELFEESGLGEIVKLSETPVAVD